jgi:hypothetical protein
MQHSLDLLKYCVFACTLLFLGTSLAGLADYLRKFTFPSGMTRQHYALIAVTGRRWRATAELLQRRYNIKIIPFPVTKQYADVDSFLEELVRKIRIQEATPASVATETTGRQLQKVVLPNMQVVASTHSPLVVGGMPVSQVLRFVRGPDGEVVMAEIDKEMTLGRADQILTGDLFGLETSLDETTQKEMEKYRALLGNRHRTDEEEEDFRRLRRVIRMRVPMTAETPPERLAQEVVTAVLKEQVGEDFPEARAAVLDRVEKLLAEIQKRQTRARK